MVSWRADLRGGADRIGYAAFLLFATTAFWGPAGPYLAILVLIPWMFHRCRSGDRALQTSSLVWLAWLLTAYIALRVLTGYLVDPSTLEWQQKTFSEYLRIGGLWAVVLAPWLADRERGTRNYHLLFGLALLGFVGESLLAFLWGDPGRAHGGRLSLVAGPNGSALVAGFFLLLVLTVGGAGLGRLAYRGRHALTLLVVPLWIALTSLLVWFLIGTGSRSAWLALAVVLSIAMAVAGCVAVRCRSLPQGRLMGAGLALVMLIGAGLLSSQYPVIEGRFAQAQDSLGKIVTLRFSELEADSVSYRIWLYEFGVPMVTEKPVAGWSPGGVEALIERRGDSRIARFSHVHNTHLEILLALGAVGSVLFYGMVVMSAVEVGNALRHGRIAPEWGIFWFMATAFVGLEEFFDTRFFIYECGLLMVLLGAVGIGCQVARRRATEENEGLSVILPRANREVLE